MSSAIAPEKSWAYADAQPGFAEEALTDVAAELVAFLNPTPVPAPPTPRQWLERLSTDKQVAIAAAARGNDALWIGTARRDAAGDHRRHCGGW
jgi:hypothetical protein